MRFPRTVFVARNGVWRQVLHLASEVWEVCRALWAGDYAHAAEELVDVQQSADTLRNILHERYGADREVAEAVVVKRTRERGYYEEGGADGYQG